MNSKYLACLALFGALLLAFVQARPQALDGSLPLVERQNNPINVIPDWVSNAIDGSTEEPRPAAPAAPVPVVTIPGVVAATTRRPQLGEVISTGLQGLFQGIIRAPGQIANRVQSILDQLTRRPTTPSPIPIPPISG